MTGPLDSVIGDDINAVLTRFLTQLPYRISVGKGNVILNSVLVEVEETTGRARHIKRIDREYE
jgi:hypothetical protein